MHRYDVNAKISVATGVAPTRLAATAAAEEPGEHHQGGDADCTTTRAMIRRGSQQLLKQHRQVVLCKARMLCIWGSEPPITIIMLWLARSY